MSNFAAVLKTEFARFARRSTAPIYKRIKHDVAALKRALAQQKRLTAWLARDNARLVADLNSRLAVPPTASDKEVRNARLGPALIHAQRRRLGLSRAAFAKLVGVSGAAVFAWEGGKARPRAAAKAALVAVRKLRKREARQRLEAMVVEGSR